MIGSVSSSQYHVLLRQITHRIHKSLELSSAIQVAVDEISNLLHLDQCLFFWRRCDRAAIEVVYQQSNQTEAAQIGTYPLAVLNQAASLVEANELVVYSGHDPRPWWQQRLGWKRSDGQLANPSIADAPNLTVFGAAANLLVPVQGQMSDPHQATQCDLEKTGYDRGYLVCLSRTRRPWSPVEIELVRSVAQQLEIAMEHTSLYEQTQKLVRREQLVSQITSQTRQSLDLETVLTQAIAQLLQALQVDRCVIHLVEDIEELNAAPKASCYSQQDNIFRRGLLFEACRAPFTTSLDNFDTQGPITQWVMAHRQTVVISDVAADPRIGADNAEYCQAQIHSSLVVPVQTRHELQAILYLNQCATARTWSAEDQHLAQSVADQLAITIQQSRLYTQTRQQALESSNQATQLMQTLQELRHTQSRLIQSEKMSSLGRMVAGVAHEINNPISFIYGNVPYVERYFKDLVRLLHLYQQRYPADEELEALADEIELDYVLQDLPQILTSMQSGSQRIREIVQSLRRFSRLHEAKRKWAQVHEGIESAIAMVQHEVGSDIQIIRRYDELPQIDCFPSLLNQVYMNLLLNSIEALRQTVQASEFSNPRETNLLIIETTSFTEAATGSAWVRITISDNGPGIVPEIQPRIFDPFFTTKNIGEGAGLGLSVSYQIVVEQHQGQIRCHSTPGEGTSFQIDLPVSPAHSATLSHYRPSSAAVSVSMTAKTA